MTRRPILAALLVAAGAVGGLLVPSAATAAPAPTVGLAVAPDDGGVVRRGHDLVVHVEVANRTAAPLPAGRVALSLEKEPVASSAALLAEVQHPREVLLGILTPTTAAVPALDAGETLTVTAVVKKDALSSILTKADGARLLYVRYRAGRTQVVAESSVVQVAASSSASVGLGAVVPVLAPAGTTGLVDTDTQEELATRGGAWDTAVRAADAAPFATVALDPAVIASIRLAGDAAPPDAAALLDRLQRLPNQVVRLPYADGDVALERAAGVRTALAPSGFTGAAVVSQASGAPTPAPTPSPAASGAADDPTGWDWSDQAVAWPVPHTASTGTLSASAAAGETVLLASDDVTDTTARRAAGPQARIGAARVLVSDATASALLTTAAGQGTTADAALATLTGVLATEAVTGEASAVLATTARTTDPGRMDRVLSSLARRPWIAGRSLAELSAEAAPTAVALKPGTIPAGRLATARSLLDGEHRVQELGRSVTRDAARVTAPQRLALLGLLSSSWRADERAWRAAAGVAEAGFTAVTGRVHLADGSDSNAIGTDGTLRVTVVNDLTEPVDVVVRASVNNGRLQFDGDSAVKVAVPPGGSNVGKLAFRTITNGSTDVTLDLETASGASLDRGVRRVTVSAGFDTIVAVVLFTALVLLLALGVHRNVTRRKRTVRTAVA